MAQPGVFVNIPSRTRLGFPTRQMEPVTRDLETGLLAKGAMVEFADASGRTLWHTEVSPRMVTTTEHLVPSS